MAPSFRLQIAAALAGLLIIGALLLRTTAISPAAVAPVPGGTFVEGVVGVPRQINPLLAGSPAERDLAGLIFAGLTRLGADGKIAPDLASTWQVSPDERQYTFFLRQDARWSDGEPVTAEDVLFTVGLLQASDFPGDPTLASLWRAVTVTRLDRMSVRFNLTQPYSPFLQYTTQGLLPAHLLRDLPPARIATADFNAAPVGAGRWCIAPCLRTVRVTPGMAAGPTPDADRGLVLEPNPYTPPPLLSRLWFRFYPTPGALLTAFDQGEVDGLGSVEPEAVAGLRGRTDVRLYSAELPATEMILLNLRLPLFDRRETRQALLLGLDRAALLAQAVSGQGQVADSPILPSSWAHTAVLGAYAYDPATAAARLNAAGWQLADGGERRREGVPLRFTLVYAADSPAMAALAQGIARQWARLGVTATPQAVPRDRLLPDYLVPRAFEAVLVGWRGAANDPDAYQLWHSTQTTTPGLNFTGFRNDRADRALEQGRQTLKQKDRAGFYATFQQVFGEEVPALMLYYPRYTYAVSTRVQGVTLPQALFDPSGRFQSLTNWYVEARAEVRGEK
jgi:peptide/nickel transport system substrate-binding protein